VIGEPLLLFRKADGNIVALEDRCCHRLAPLSLGRREGDCVRCGYHGMKFDASGACVEVPGLDTVPPKAKVRSYPIVVRNKWVFVWMGDPARIDMTMLPDNFSCDHPDWRNKPGYLHYDANYLLIVDNLADFAHLAFVHRHTLGGSEAYAFKTKPVEVERQPRGFRVKRMHMNAEVPPFHRKVTRSDERIDRWNVGTMHIPGVFFLESGFAPAGSGIERGDISQARQYRNCQFFTPETARSTHFFWNYLHNWNLDDATIALSLHDSMVEGFHEDKAIIEQQQKTFDADPAFRVHPIAADAPLAHFRRVLAQLIAQERGAALAA
jgi:vanillate O-demethylase monooxygenase subunit